MSDNKIILIGGGGHCHSCIDVIETSGKYRIAGIIDRRKDDGLESVLGYPVIGDETDLETLREKYTYALVTVGQVGTARVRRRIFDLLKKLKFKLPEILSPRAHVSKHAKIEEGSIILHNVIVNAGARIGKNNIINTMCLIEHDVRVGDHNHISTAAVLNGGVSLGSGCFVGSNTTVIQEAVLPDNWFFKAGSLVRGPKDGHPVLNEDVA